MWQGEALPVLSCSCCETSDGLQREQGCTLTAQRGTIQLEAGMSAGVNAGLETGGVARWLLFLAQPAAGCATSGKSLLLSLGHISTAASTKLIP